MTQYYIKGNLGDQPKDFTTGTGSPSVSAGQFALTFDPGANMTRGQLEVILEKLEIWVPGHSFPPA